MAEEWVFFSILQLFNSLGCGRSFSWGAARVFNPDKKLEIGASSIRNNHEHVVNPQNESQASDALTEEAAFIAATTNTEPDFQPFMELLNARFSAWLERRRIATPVEITKAFLALITVNHYVFVNWWVV